MSLHPIAYLVIAGYTIQIYSIENLKSYLFDGLESMIYDVGCFLAYKSLLLLQDKL